MSKKIMLCIVAVILLVGVENLIAQERRGRPEAEPQQKGQVEQFRRQRGGEEAGPAREEGMQQRRRLRAVREAEPERVRALQQKPQQLRPGQVRPMQEGAGRLLDELTKAYRENDREKMGQLIRKMHQLRQRVQKARATPGERVRDLRGRPEAAQPGAKKERPERLKAPPTDTDWPGPLMPRRGMGRRGQGMQGRGMMMQGRGMGRWGRGMRGRGMMMQGRGMGRWGQGMQGRGMMMQRRSMDRPGPGMPAPEDVDRPGPMMQRRGMGGWGRGVPGPWCPWWSAPGPETD